MSIPDGPYLGDLEKTAAIDQLIQIPYEQRDSQWDESLIANLPEASFTCGNPQVIAGPDGFPYFQLFLPEPGVAFQCFVINRMKDDFLLENGMGVVINPVESGADWVLTYGDILNLHLNKVFYTTEGHSFAGERRNEVVDEEEQVMVAQPSEALWPLFARKVLRDFLLQNGIEEPKILLMMRHHKGDSLTQDIVFNITRNDFQEEGHYQSVMHAIRWFLPQHYSYAGMEEIIFGDAFEPL